MQTDCLVLLHNTDVFLFMCLGRNLSVLRLVFFCELSALEQVLSLCFCVRIYPYWHVSAVS